MHKSNSFILLGLSVLVLSACGSSNDKSNWGTLDDITVNNRGIAPAKKVTSDAASEEAKLAEVKEKVNQVIDDAVYAKATPPVTEIKTKQVEVETVIDEVVEGVAEDAVTEVEMSEPVQAVQEMAEVKAEVAEVKEVTPMARTEMRPSPEVIAARQKKEAAMSMGGDLPSNAKPGECYAKVLIPAKVQGIEERVQISEEQKILARIIPSQYEIRRERVLIKEAMQVWKPGRGAQEKVSQTTGEILCLVEEPAVYKTIEKRILIAPERPEYKVIPARYETIMRTETLESSRMEWRRILCETNVTPAVIMSIQSALNAKGYNAGNVDGRFGSKTNSAVSKYQRDNNLPVSGLSYATIDALGIKL